MFACYRFVLLLMFILCFCVLLVRDWVVASDVAFLRWFGYLRAASSLVPLIHLKFAIEIGLLCSKELLCLMRCSGGCWYVDRITVSIHSPIENLVDLVDAHSSPFLLSSFFRVIGFTRWRSWGMFVLLGLIRLVHMVCIFMFDTLLSCTCWVRFYVPPVSVSLFIYLISFLPNKKKNHYSYPTPQSKVPNLLSKFNSKLLILGARDLTNMLSSLSLPFRVSYLV